MNQSDVFCALDLKRPCVYDCVVLKCYEARKGGKGGGGGPSSLSGKQNVDAQDFRFSAGVNL